MYNTDDSKGCALSRFAYQPVHSSAMATPMPNEQSSWTGNFCRRASVIIICHKGLAAHRHSGYHLSRRRMHAVLSRFNFY